MGGAGKTPVAIKLASLLREAGRRPAFLTRGYGGSERGPHVVSSAADTADRVGDEPLLLARNATTVVSRDRPAGARLIETLDSDTIVMDDGFQNPSVIKDFRLVVVDGSAGLGSGHVFPLGPLRASLGFQAAMADAIVVLGGGEDRNRILAGVFAARRQQIFNAGIVPLITDELLGRPYLAFCGIGRPAKFFDTLRNAGIEVVKARGFPDHHPYSEDDALALLTEAKALNAGLVTTEKDRVRLLGKSGLCSDLYRSVVPLPITIQFAGNDQVHLLQTIEMAVRAA